MIFRNLTSSGDWTFGSGTGNYLSGNPAIGLNIKTRLLSWLNNCFFDMTAGINWPTRLGGKNQQLLLELDLRRIILQSFGVTSLNSFSYSLVVRSFSATFNIDTIFSAAYQNTINQDFGVQGS
jgi:hypothetical protein